MTIAELSVKIGANVSDFEKGIAKAHQTTQSFGQRAKSHFESIKNAIIGIGTAVLGGGGLFALAQSAITAGDNVYKLSQKLHISGTEAALLSRELGLAGVDTNAFTSTIIRLDKSVESAGKKGNTVTNTMREFGVSITDAHGKLLPIPDQLARLAEGYERASAAGKEQEYVVGVLGTRGASLIPMLSDYVNISKQAAAVKSIGINPEQAHVLAQEMSTLKMIVGQLGMTFANALMPIVAQLLPKIIAGANSLVSAIKSHKSEIVGVITGIFNVVKELVDHWKIFAPLIASVLAGFLAYKAVVGVMNTIKTATEAWSNAQKILNLTMRANPIGLIITAIMLLIAIVVIVIENWKGISTFFSKLWTTIKKLFFEGVNAVAGFLRQWGPTVLGVLTGGLAPMVIYIVTHWNQIKKSTVDALNNLKTSISNGLNAVKNFFVTIWNRIVNSVKTVINGFVNFIQTKFGTEIFLLQSIWMNFKNIFVQIWNIIKTVVLGVVLLLCDLITGNFTRLKSDATKIFQKLAEYFRNIWESIKQIFTAALLAIELFITGAWNDLKNGAVGVWTALTNWFVNMWNNLRNTAINAWDSLRNGVVNLCNNIRTGIINIWNGILSWFWNLPGTLYNLGVNMFSAMRNGVSNAISWVRGVIINGINSAISWLGSLPGRLYSWGVDMIQGLINGIRNMISRVGSAIGDVANRIRSILHFSRPDEGPLADYEKWMPDFMAGLAKGIQNSKGIVSAAINGLGSDINIGMHTTLIPPMAIATAPAGNTSGPVALNMTFNFTGPITVRSDDDLRRLGQEIGKELYYRGQSLQRATGRR